MNALVALILIGALGFVFSRFLFLRPKPGSFYERFMLSGVEFLVIGALIGPNGLRILDRGTVFSLEPFLLLALSWVGLLIGLQLRWKLLTRFPWSYFQVTFVQAGVILLITFAGLSTVFHLWSPIASVAEDRWRAALCLAAVAVLSSPAEAALYERRARGGHAAGLLRFIPGVDPIVALAGIGFLFAFWHPANGSAVLDLAPWGWLLASLGVGALLGGLFLLLLRTTSDQDELVLVVLGMALFSGGLSAVFQLSPLVLCLVQGIVLSNLSTDPDKLLFMFMRLERPLYVILLVLAGASWRFGEAWGYGLAALFIAFKFATTYLGVRAAVAVTSLPFSLPGRWWMGLVPHGAVSVAMVVSYTIAYDDRLAQTVFGAVLVSMVFMSLLSRNLVNMALQERDS